MPLADAPKETIRSGPKGRLQPDMPSERRLRSGTRSLVTQARHQALKDMRLALQSGFERMVVRMIDLTTKFVHVVHECLVELLLFFVTQRERHCALSFVEP